MTDIRHIVLATHPPSGSHKPPEITWGAGNAQDRGPVIGGLSGGKRNVIGAHSGSYGVYRALAVASGDLSPVHRPDLSLTRPSVEIGPFPQWDGEDRIVSLDPYGHIVADAFEGELAAGAPIQPTIAITKARIMLPEFKDALRAGRLKPDGRILTKAGEANVTKIAIEPVWYLPGLARRLDVTEVSLRHALFEYTGGMFPELVTRSDLKVFLPPIGSITLYVFGAPEALWTEGRRLACRVHDECNGSDVFGSDICTCRPYLTHGIEECVQEAQTGGAGLIVYNRKEGRALGEVTKFLVYNARKRNPDGDTAEAYFEKTECVAGVQDMRFQSLMPDVFHWLGITHIDRFVSMSDMKFNALAEQGITVGERIPIPDELIPGDAHVEMDAKKAAGYYTDDSVSTPDDLSATKGRNLNDY
ncbi:MAG: GTP cyclohydrolase II [Dinoroseobacter sp.]|nr:GTP cyclohydrolase II [Dinoroseobacter sp.]